MIERLQPLGQAGAALFSVGFLDRNTQRPPLAYEDDPILAARDGGVDQRPREHDGVRALDVDDDGSVLGALGFVDRGRITVIQHLKIRGVVFFDAAVSEIHTDGRVVLGLGDARDHPDISVADVVVVPGLHDLVALAEDSFSTSSLSLI